MQATITGSASAGTMTGGRCRIQIAGTTQADLRDGQSSAFGGTLTELGQKLDCDRFKTDPTPGVGASATGTVAVDNTGETNACKVVFRPGTSDAQVLLTVPSGGSDSVDFTIEMQGDQLSVEHA